MKIRSGPRCKLGLVVIVAVEALSISFRLSGVPVLKHFRSRVSQIPSREGRSSQNPPSSRADRSPALLPTLWTSQDRTLAVERV